MKNALLIFVIIIAMPSCYAAVSRNDVVSFSLDYHERRKKVDSEKEKIEKEKKSIVEEKKKESKVNWHRKSEKVKQLLDDLHWTIDVSETYDDNIYATR